MVFATFSDLGDWLGIYHLKDICSMTYRTTSTPHHTLFQLLGKIQYSAGDESLPLNVFIGRSASKWNVSDTDSRLVFDRETCFSIPNMTWDIENMNFVHQWNYSIQFLTMETVWDRIIGDFNCFSIRWSPYHDCNRRTLSADTIYLRANPLGKLTAFIQVVKVCWFTFMSIYDIVTDLEYYF